MELCFVPSLASILAIRLSIDRIYYLAKYSSIEFVNNRHKIEFNICNAVRHMPICTCLNGYTGDAITQCTLVPAGIPVVEETDPCDPNPCGAYSQHKEQNGVCVCSCEAAMIGAPPNCRPECLVSSECSQTTACMQQRCRDPCPGLCGANADCRVTNHNPICTCRRGYEGDPFSGCSRIPRKLGSL